MQKIILNVKTMGVISLHINIHFSILITFTPKFAPRNKTFSFSIIFDLYDSILYDWALKKYRVIVLPMT